MDERIPYLLEIPSKHKWISVKPFIGEVDLDKYLATGQIETVLAGGENYLGSRPLHYEWVKKLHDQCEKYDIHFIFGQTGNVFVKDGKIYKIRSRKEVRNGYRERSQRSIQEYIIENTVLKNRIIWVKGMLNSQVSDWLSFCRDYNSNNEENGLFVLEIQGGVHKQDNNMRSIRLLECISNYDVQLFSSFIVEEKSALSNVWRRYLSTATAIICDIDAEIASHLLEIIDPKKQSPLDIIMEMASWQEYSVRGADDESNHIFMHCRNNNKNNAYGKLKFKCYFL